MGPLPVVAPVTLFQSQNYKLCVSLGLSLRAVTPVRAVLDTGAGPNLVREDVLPMGWQKFLVPGQALPRVNNASGRRMPVKGVVALTVQVGEMVRRVRFIVASSLSVPCILGCHFINAHVYGIFPRERRVDLREGGSISLLGKFDACRPSQAALSVTPASNKVRLARTVAIAPRTEAHVQVVCAVSGLCLLIGDTKLRKSPVSLASGVAEVRPHVPFRVRVINPTHQTSTLPKGMVIGHAEFQPEQILSLDADPEGPSGGVPSVAATSVPKDATQGVEVPWSDRVDLAHLDPKERTAVLAMLEPHREMWDGRLGTVTATSHRIDVVPGAKPIHAQPYRAGARAREVERQEIEKMLTQKVIEPASSEWASPIVLVPKSDGSLRFCVDYRRLNAITVPDTYPLPRMDECIDSLGDAAVFTTLDCNSGYWQIPVRPADRDKTTFTSHYGIYRFLRLPFGLRNAPATFQRAIDVILSGIKWNTCLVYLDDVIIFSPDRVSHLRHVDEALTLLRNAGLSLKLGKCRFFSETVDYLGHVIRPGRLGVAEKNTDALRGAPCPTTQTELRSFLGLCNVYRRFVPHFSSLAAPLNAYLTKGKPPLLGKLSDAAISAFETLRKKLLSPPVLALPRSKGQLWLDTDASQGQLGCCLLQKQPEGPPLPLGYWSRTLNAAERNYSTTEKECLAIVWAVTHLRPYLEGVEFTVRTDHHALRWVMNLAEAQGRLARWRLRLSEFSFKVEYSPGATHHAADTMSRLPKQAVPDDPIDVDIPVDSVSINYLSDPLTPRALEPDTPDPIQETELLVPAEVFDHQCRDPVSRHLSSRLGLDPTWDYDGNGLLVHRAPSGEIQVHIPPVLRPRGPFAIVQPLAEDGSDLSGGVQAEFTAPEVTADDPVLPIGRPSPQGQQGPEERPRILWNPRSPNRSQAVTTSHCGLALATEWTSDSESHIPGGNEENEGALTPEEIREAQGQDDACRRLLAIQPTKGVYDLDEEGLLIRIAPSDGTRQIVVPPGLIRRVLYNEHYPVSAGHPGAHKMFLTIRRSFFWPGMAADVYETVRRCDSCARNRISENRRTNPLKLFPAKGPLESLAMDILGPMPRTRHGNRFLLVITDRYSKVTKTVPLRVVTALSVARAFCDHWVFSYGAPVSLLTDNGPQFTAKFFQAVCGELGVKKVFTTAYHPQSNGQVERYNRTILAALRGYVARRQDDWDDYTSSLTYAYNCRVHASLGMPPFELALTRPPPTTALQVQPRAEELAPLAQKQAFLERLKTLRLRADGQLSTAQERYKRSYDRGVKPKNARLREGDEAYVRVEVTDAGRSHKLESQVHGPYRVLENAGHTLRLQVGLDAIRVSSDRVTPAPGHQGTQQDPVVVPEPRESPAQEPDPVTEMRASQRPVVAGPGRTPERWRKEGASATQKPNRVRFDIPSDCPTPRSREEYVIDRLVDVEQDAQGKTFYRVRWLGYKPEEDTWEWEGNLPNHFIRRYKKGASRKARGDLRVAELMYLGLGPHF